MTKRKNSMDTLPEWEDVKKREPQSLEELQRSFMEIMDEMDNAEIRLMDRTNFLLTTEPWRIQVFLNKFEVFDEEIFAIRKRLSLLARVKSHLLSEIRQVKH